MENNIVVKVPNRKDSLEEIIASTDYSLERLSGIKERPSIKTKTNIDSIKPILMNLEKKLDEQNAKKKTSPKSTTKEKLITMKYLLPAVIGDAYRSQKSVNKLLSILCDLEENSITDASKNINDTYMGYTTAKECLNTLERIKNTFENLRSKSYNENNIAHRKQYEKLNEVLKRINEDITKIECKNKRK